VPLYARNIHVLVRLITPERFHAHSCLRVPELDGAIQAPADKNPPAGTEQDRAYLSGVPLQGERVGTTDIP